MRRLALVLLAVVCACGSVGQPASPGGRNPTGSASASQPALSGTGSEPMVSPTGALLSEPALRYRLIDGLGAPVYCDRSQYPVARAEDPADAAAGVAALRSQDPAEFDAIVRHERLDPNNLSPADDVRILGQAAMLAAVPLTPHGERYGFRYQVVGPPSTEVTGTIDRRGAVEVTSRAPAPRHQCPICLARWTLIATPIGEVPVTAIRPGMLVWTLDAAGRRVPGPVLLVGHTPAPAGHHVVHLVLADGRSVDASPGHPLPDGRAVAALAPGDPMDGSVVAGVERRPYDGGATWDLLPAGTTHLYWADGIPLGSTLAPGDES